MWGFIFGHKKEEVLVTRTVPYKEGQVVYQPGDFPHIPKIVYKILQDGTIMAAEFLAIDDDVMFVKNVALEERQLISHLTEPYESYAEWMSDNWAQYKASGQFIKSKKKHEADRAASNEKFFDVECMMNNREPIRWYNLAEAMAIKLYHDLKSAQVRKSNWELAANNDERQFIVGEYISSVTMRKRK